MLQNPYIGPRTFQYGEAFYGRENELRQVKEQLIVDRLVLLHSPSGAGKSSLIRAGLLSLMQEEDFHILPVIRLNLEPLDGLYANRYALSMMLSLEEGLEKANRLDLPELAALSLDEYLKQRYREPDAPPSDLLVFDQFEEVLTADPMDLAEKEEFFRQLGFALRNRDRFALFAIREDYLGALAPYQRHLPGHLSSTYRIDLLSREAALHVVIEPARRSGVVFSDEAAHMLVDDLSSVQVQRPDGSIEMVSGPYVEPVQLQVVASRLWESLPPDSQEITREDLLQSGDVSTALVDFYDSSVAAVAEQAGLAEGVIRRWFETRLITAAGTRGSVPMGPDTSEGLDNRAIYMLQNRYLIRAEKRGGVTWFELPHDRMVQPVRESNARWFDAHLVLFQRQAVLWQSQGRPDSLLLSGRELAEAEQQAQQMDLAPVEQEFLRSSRRTGAGQARQQRRDRILVVLLALSFLLNIVLSVLLVLARAVR